MEQTKSVLNIFLYWGSRLTYSILNSKLQVLDSLLTSVLKFYRIYIEILWRPRWQPWIIWNGAYRWQVSINARISRKFDERRLRIQYSSHRHKLNRYFLFLSKALSSRYSRQIVSNQVRKTNEQLLESKWKRRTQKKRRKK